MVGIIPSTSRTFEVDGDLSCTNPVEGKLYYDKNDNRVYMYTKSGTRSNPSTGYFPVWDGKNTYVTQFSNDKRFDKDVIKTDVDSLSKSIDGKVADHVRYLHRRSDCSALLKPEITDGDNMFTQCIKGVICSMDLTMVDLVDMSSPKLSEKVIENYYSALTKITFMRLDKWNVWINVILHIGYNVTVYKKGKPIVSYTYPDDVFETGVVKYNDIISTKDDPFKKIIKILIVMENINKSSLRSEDVDDYTINNMLTTLNGTKPLSAQLFSRFIRMANLSYGIDIFDSDKNVIFKFKE